MNKLHRSTKKMIAGVCAGLAETFGIEPFIIRLIFILSIFYGGGGIVFYIILWILLPINEKQEQTPVKRIYRSDREKFIAGVCGGLSNYLNWDVTLIRIIFVILALSGGIGIILYLLLWITIPLENKQL